MARRTRGTKGRYIEHAGRDFTRQSQGLGRFFGDVKHYKKGQIIDNVSVKRSLSQDRRTKSKRTVKSGYGHKGDLKVVRKKRRDGIVQRYHIKRKRRFSEEQLNPLNVRAERMVAMHLHEAQHLDNLESSHWKSGGLTRNDWSKFEGLVCKANRTQLDKMSNRIKREIRLSETAIQEGMEVRR